MNLDEKFLPKLTVYEYNIIDVINGILINKDFDRTTIKDIIKRQHSMLLNYNLFLSSKRDSMQALFTNTVFLDCFNDVAGMLDLSKEELKCINKIAFDYVTMAEKDKNIMDLLLSIIYQTNEFIIKKISGLVTINDKRMISMICLSDFDKFNVIHRINAFLEICETDTRSNSIPIMFLYESLVNNHLIDYYSLITATMIEYPDNRDQTVYMNISRAIIDILEFLSNAAKQNAYAGDVNILNILYNYGFFIKTNNIDKVRFSMKQSILNQNFLDLVKKVEEDYQDMVKII